MTYQALREYLQSHNYRIVQTYGKEQLLYIYVITETTGLPYLIKIPSTLRYTDLHMITIDTYDIGALDIFAMASDAIFQRYKNNTPIHLESNDEVLNLKSLGRQLKRLSL